MLHKTIVLATIIACYKIILGMWLKKKRSWSTALGDPAPSPALGLCLPHPDQRCPTATAAAPSAFHDIPDPDPEFEASAATLPLNGTHSPSHFSDDATSLEDWKCALEQEGDLDLESGEDILDKTPISSLFEEGETSVDTHGPTTVCYGQVRDVYASATYSPLIREIQISSAFAKLFPISQCSSIPAPQQDTLYSIRIRSDGITLCDPDAQEVGELDRRHTEVIRTIKTQVPSLGCETLFCLGDDMSGGNLKKRARLVVSCEMNLYGPASDALKVGTCLGEAKIFLQEPRLISRPVPYYNPHVYSTTEDLFTPFLVNQRSQADDRFDQEINNILFQTHHDESRAIFEQDRRIKTLLQPHQIAALNFMLIRETTDGRCIPPTMWKRSGDSHRPMYIHKLTREKSDTWANECTGGLLADEMGLGKSLSLLALIINTLEEARSFAMEPSTTGTRQYPRIGATLIVTPYSTLQTWQDEISKHIDANALRVYIHHGQTKTRLHSELQTAQVVLTTYETITSGRRSASNHLGRFSWFRVALDEAHWIRNRSTQVFQALHEFEAQRRWCMTGTPVQNGLNDLCALTRWLRYYPFDKSHSFRKFITDPLSKRNEIGLANLRQMTQVFQMRRVKAGMNLGQMELKTITVSLSSEERNQYESAKATILKTMAEASKTNDSKPSTSILRGIQTLRRICCDGILPRSTAEQHVSGLPLWSRNIPCTQCGRAVGKSVRASIFGHCGHVLCNACSTRSPLGGDEQEVLGVSCSICGTIEEEPTSLDDASLTGAYDGRVSLTGLLTGLDTEQFTPAKIATVASKLIELHQSSFQSDHKSLVFSYWKHALSSLESELQRCSIRCVRIDGDHSADERARALSAFRTSPEVQVMLLTFGVGSVGLTLTEATHIHLVEPHWNPMVEEQAIARAHRIGQDKLVTVWRYIVENSIEERIIRKQSRKLYLAKIAHTKDIGSRTNGHEKQNHGELEDLLEECHLLQG